MKSRGLYMIIYTCKGMESYLGKTCKVLGSVPKDEMGHHLEIDVDGQRLLAASKCLMKIDPDKELKKEIKKEKEAMQ